MARRCEGSVSVRATVPVRLHLVWVQGVSRGPPEQPVDGAARDTEVLGDPAGPIVAVSRLISEASILAGRPLYLPLPLALAILLRWRSSMISRSQVATPAKIVSMSFERGLRVSSRSPPNAQDHQADAALGQVRLDR
jgi:hypothetical protein